MSRALKLLRFLACSLLPVFAVIACLASGASIVQAGNWKTVFEQDGLLVEQRPYKDSPLMELRGQVNVRASLNAVMALLKDADYNQE